jgi:hypothetical protein
MSRYLDRMIAGARGPVSNVRPVLRPFFLETTGQRDGPVEESREVSSPAPASRVAAHTPAASVPKPSGLRNDSHSPATQELAPESHTTVAAQRENYPPLVLETRRVEQVVEHVAINRNEPLRRNFAETPAPSSDDRPLVATETSSPSPFATKTEPREHVVQIETRSASQPVQRIPAAPKPSASAQDQIEIHVGRIEIIAAPPPVAPVAAPRRSRSSVNLAEYLKRGERT